MLIEPNKLILNTAKENISSINPQPLILECAVGNREEKTFLNVWDNVHTSMAGSSLLSHVQGEPKEKIEIDMKTLDAISREFSLKPDLVKLDLQGYEIYALEGAKEILEMTELFIIEFGCLEAYAGRTTPRDLINMMYNHNYCLYDIVDLIYRPFDHALAGGDFFFIKNDSALKKYKGFI